MKRTRLLEIDFARGLALVIMFLSHVDAKINPYAMGAEGLYGTYPIYENLYSFMVRFVQVPAIMAFFILAGMSIGIQMYLQERKQKKISGLFSRGVLLIVVQLTIISLGWWLLYFSSNLFITAGVLIAFGVSFMCMHFIVKWLHPYTIGLIGFSMLMIREWFSVDFISTTSTTYNYFVRTFFISGSEGIVSWYYPVYSWLAVIMMGCAIGYWYVKTVELEKYNHVYAWVATCAALVLWWLVRANTQFGNFNEIHDGSVLGMLTLSKYPPSVMFCFLGIILGAFWVIVGRYSWVQKVSQSVIYLGQNSLQTYMIHLYVIALLYYVLNLFTEVTDSMVPIYTFAMVVMTWVSVVCIIYYIKKVTILLKK